MSASLFAQMLKNCPTFDVHECCEHPPDPSEDLAGAIAFLKNCIVAVAITQRGQHGSEDNDVFASILMVFKLCLDLGYNVQQEFRDGEELNISAPVPNGYVVKFARGKGATDFESAFCIEPLNAADLERIKRAQAKRQRKARQLELK